MSLQEARLASGASCLQNGLIQKDFSPRFYLYYNLEYDLTDDLNAGELKLNRLRRGSTARMEKLSGRLPMAVTIRASQEGLKRIDQARKRRGWKALAPAWYDAAKVSQSTLKRFREGKAIQQDSFIAICEAVGIQNWEDIVENHAKAIDSSVDQSRFRSYQESSEQINRIDSPTAEGASKYNFSKAHIGIANIENTVCRDQIGFQNGDSGHQAIREINVFRDVQVGTSLTTGDITINLSDNPQKRTDQAKKLFETEIANNLLSIDARLGFAEATLATDSFESQLMDIRDRVAPAVNRAASLGYKRLIMQQSVPALRQALNSRPLRIEAGTAIAPVLLESGIDPYPVQSFYERLTDVQDVSESLIGVLSDAVSSNLTDPQTAEHYQNWIDLEVQRLHNRSMMAHLSGLMALQQLGGERSRLNAQLTHLQYLEPQALIDPAELEIRLADYMREAHALLKRRAELVVDGEQMLARALQAYEEINELLEIKPTDTWGQVVGKAISLRQLGRTTEAVAAFAKYGEKFANSDSTAQNYAKTAQQLTLQIEELGIEGGVYIYDLLEAGRAHQAGIPVGAIVIDYGGRSIQNMDDLVTALKQIPSGEPTRLTYLEMDKFLTFQRQTKTIIGGPLGAGFMPI
jgi:hypothetical protein